MSRRPAGRGAVLGVALAGLLLAGCGADADDEEKHVDAAQQLEQQREEVRARAVELVPLLARQAAGTVTGSNGRFDGCTTAGPDFEYRDFSYGVSARIEPGDAGPVLARLGERLEAQGYTLAAPRTEGGRTSLSAERADSDVTVTLTEYTGTDHVVLVGLGGPCVEVPEDERGAWGRRREPEPQVLPG